MSTVVPVVIAPYDPVWALRFEREAERLHGALGALALRIDHVGSTSVPGLAAKPVIDIQISVIRLAPLQPLRSALAEAGYAHFPSEDDDRLPFFHRPETWPHDFHIHACVAGSREERRHLAFRDHLRENPDAATRYETLKRTLAAEHHAATFEARQAYANAKTDFIAPIERELLGTDTS
jgi:GrpB-like predicted nucleotidyltransferase (UPF0157 family)